MISFKNTIKRLKRLNARANNKLFIIFERFQLYIFFRKKLKILFSPKQDWEPIIKNGFQYTQHEILFDEISSSNIKDYDLIVPLTIYDLKYLNEVRNLIIDNSIPIPSMENILLCDDKDLFNKTLIAKGFGYLIPNIGCEQTYPYILKKKIDEWGANSHIIFNAEQEYIFSDALTNPEYFSQRLIIGSKEYATHILIKDMQIICSLTIEYNFETETPIKGKDEPIYTKVIFFPPYLKVFSSVLTTINFNGLCCINYKVYKNSPFIMEINPRFGGSLGLYFFSFIRHIVK
jgi:hypothetical protein